MHYHLKHIRLGIGKFKPHPQNVNITLRIQNLRESIQYSGDEPYDKEKPQERKFQQERVDRVDQLAYRK